jgi:hypothetical protein
MASRRDFLKCQWLNTSTDKRDAKTEASRDIQDYFSSFDNCYALMSEVPLEEVLETAKARGIDIRDKSKMELVKELFRRHYAETE